MKFFSIFILFLLLGGCLTIPFISTDAQALTYVHSTGFESNNGGWTGSYGANATGWGRNTYTASDGTYSFFYKAYSAGAGQYMSSPLFAGVSYTDLDVHFDFRYDFNSTDTDSLDIMLCTSAGMGLTTTIGVSLRIAFDSLTNQIKYWNQSSNSYVNTNIYVLSGVWYDFDIIQEHRGNFFNYYLFVNNTPAISGALLHGRVVNAVTTLSPQYLAFFQNGGLGTGTPSNFIMRIDDIGVGTGLAVPAYYEQEINYVNETTYQITYNNQTYWMNYTDWVNYTTWASTYNNNSQWVNSSDWVNYTNWVNNTNANNYFYNTTDWTNYTIWNNQTEYHLVNNSMWENYTLWLNVTGGGGNTTITGNTTGGGGFSMESGYLILLIVFTILNIIGYFKMPILQLLIIILTILVSVISLSTFGDDYLIPFSFILINIVIGVIGLARGIGD